MFVVILLLLFICLYCFICVNNLFIISMVYEIIYMNNFSKFFFIYKFLLVSKVIEV